MTKIGKTLSAIALLCACATADAKGVPSWLRVVDLDGQVLDVPALGINSITVCASRGDADLFAQNDGAGQAVIDTAWGEVRLAYDFKFYNTGTVTGNPNITGDQVVLIESTDRLFGSNFESCEVYQ